MADSELGDLLLKILSQRDSIDSYELAKELGKDHQTIVGAINSLRSLGNVRVSKFLFFLCVSLNFSFIIINAIR